VHEPPFLWLGGAAVTAAIAVATLPPDAPGWVGAGAGIGLLLAGGIAPRGRRRVVLRRGLLVGPFILFLAAAEGFRPDAAETVGVAGLAVPLGLVRALTLLLKTYTAVAIGLAWGERVGAHGIARTLQKVRAPASAVAVTFLTVNFLATLGREWDGVRLAARARGLRAAGYAARLKQLGSSLMSVLVRSIRRGERIGLAMRARGYAGRLPVDVLPPRRLTPVHGSFLLAAAAVAAMAVLSRTTP
jgi:cobalt/nickel transport system permease protein